jgi:hypothetical protein
MRRCLFVLVTLSSFTTIASAQSPAPAPPVPVQGGNGVFFFSGATTIAGRTNPDDILARMLSFDTNHDGRIAASELPERMQPLVTRGDANLDGVLETTEIRTLSLRPATFPPVRGFGGHPGGYGFGDEGGIGSVSSRSHIEGALDDLRLSDATKAQALTVAMRFMDNLEVESRATLLKEMDALLSPEQLTAFTAALDQQQSGQRMIIVRPKEGGGFKMGTLVDARMEQFALPEAKQREGLAAVERYKNSIRPGDTERVALVAQLSGILNNEERDNLTAALARRPLVKAGGPTAVNFTIDGDLRVPAQGVTTIVRPAILKTVITTAGPVVVER